MWAKVTACFKPIQVGDEKALPLIRIPTLLLFGHSLSSFHDINVDGLILIEHDDPRRSERF